MEKKKKNRYHRRAWIKIKATKEHLQLSTMQDSAQKNTYAGAGCQWGLSEDVEHSYILGFISGQNHSFSHCWWSATGSASQGFCLISGHSHEGNYLYNKLAWVPELSHGGSSPRIPISVLISAFMPQFSPSSVVVAQLVERQHHKTAC